MSTVQGSSRAIEVVYGDYRKKFYVEKYDDGVWSMTGEYSDPQTAQEVAKRNNEHLAANTIVHRRVL